MEAGSAILWQRRTGRRQAYLEDVLNAEEVAQLLRINPRTVKRLASQHILPGFRVGSQWRFRREAIEAYIRKQERLSEDQERGDGES